MTPPDRINFEAILDDLDASEINVVISWCRDLLVMGGGLR